MKEFLYQNNYWYIYIITVENNNLLIEKLIKILLNGKNGVFLDNIFVNVTVL